MRRSLFQHCLRCHILVWPFGVHQELCCNQFYFLLKSRTSHHIFLPNWIFVINIIHGNKCFDIIMGFWRIFNLNIHTEKLTLRKKRLNFACIITRKFSCAGYYNINLTRFTALLYMAVIIIFNVFNFKFNWTFVKTVKRNFESFNNSFLKALSLSSSLPPVISSRFITYSIPSGALAKQ